MRKQFSVAYALHCFSMPAAHDGSMQNDVFEVHVILNELSLARAL
jgi:hypothetical protein